MSNTLYYCAGVAGGFTVMIQSLIIVGRTVNSTSLEFYCRLTGFFAALLICAVYGTVSSAALTLVGLRGLGQWTTARSFKWIMLLTTGVWFDVDDKNDYLGTTRPAVFVGNHQTEFDILLLGHIFPKYCSVTAKKSLAYVPFLGWFMTLSMTVFIERESRSQAFAAFTKAANQMRTVKQSVFLFPEGTRSYYDKPDLLPFKKGAFHLAIQAQVPVVPIVCANYSNVLNFKRRIFRSGRVPVTVLPPIETKGKTKDDVDALLEETRSAMLQALKAITARAQETGVARKDA